MSSSFDFKYEASATMAKFHMDDSFVRGVMGPIGCLDSETEFLTVTGWKRIADWRKGDKVAQWWSGKNEIDFVSPIGYVKLPCDYFWRFSNARSMDMVLSDEHRVPYYDEHINFNVASAGSLAEMSMSNPDLFSCLYIPRLNEKMELGIFRTDRHSVERLPSPDGFKYCFVIPSSYFVARRNGRIFITGNSGKSTGMVWEILLRSFAQKPGNDGIRRTRWAVIRNCYSDLKSTTIKTFSDWINPVVCPIKMDHPIVGRLRMPCATDGGRTSIDAEVFFFPLDNDKDVRRLLGLELTGAWINEAKEVGYEFVSTIISRLNRYPSMKDGGATWSGLIMDTNPPDTDHWWYRMAEEMTPENWKFYRQPGGLEENKQTGLWEPNPLAENVAYLGGGYKYYKNMLGGKKREWVNVFVGGNYGNSTSGKPVFPEYKEQIHYANQELSAYKQLPLLLGFDFGVRFCACVMGQITPKGQLIILDEYIGEDTGIKGFAENVIRPVLVNVYGGMKIQPFGDPAGLQRASTDEKTCFDILRECGIPIAAPTLNNTFSARREAVAFFMTKMVDGVAGFKLSSKCPMLKKALGGEYMYERVLVKGKEFYKDQPAKNKYSHCSDSLQYLCLGTGIVPITGSGHMGNLIEVKDGDWGGFKA